MHSDIRYCSYTDVLVRVAYRLIVRDYHRRSAPYEVPALGILNLATQLHEAGFVTLFYTLMGAAKWCRDGYSLREWRDMPSYAARDRSISKRTRRRY